jgi:hypothetical protein
VAIYQLGAVRTSVTAPGTVMGPGRYGSGHRQGSPVSQSLAAGMSAEAGRGSDTQVIALVAAIALCTLATARAFRSEPIHGDDQPRSETTHKETTRCRSQ